MKTCAVLMFLLLVGCTVLAPRDEFRRGNDENPDIANAQIAVGQTIRVGYDCTHTLFGLIPIWGLDPDVDRAKADVHPPQHYTSKTETVYFRKTYSLLTVRECWEAWVRFEGVQ